MVPSANWPETMARNESAGALAAAAIYLSPLPLHLQLQLLLPPSLLQRLLPFALLPLLTASVHCQC